MLILAFHGDTSPLSLLKFPLPNMIHGIPVKVGSNNKIVNVFVEQSKISHYFPSIYNVRMIAIHRFHPWDSIPSLKSYPTMAKTVVYPSGCGFVPTSSNLLIFSLSVYYCPLRDKFNAKWIQAIPNGEVPTNSCRCIRHRQNLAMYFWQIINSLPMKDEWVYSKQWQKSLTQSRAHVCITRYINVDLFFYLNGWIIKVRLHFGLPLYIA